MNTSANVVTDLLSRVCNTSAGERAVRGDIEDYEDGEQISRQRLEVGRDNNDSEKGNCSADYRSDDPQNHLAERRAVSGKRGYQYSSQNSR